VNERNGLIKGKALYCFCLSRVNGNGAVESISFQEKDELFQRLVQSPTLMIGVFFMGRVLGLGSQGKLKRAFKVRAYVKKARLNYSRVLIARNPRGRGKFTNYRESLYIVSYRTSPGSEENYHYVLWTITYYRDSLYRDSTVFNCVSLQNV